MKYYLMLRFSFLISETYFIKYTWVLQLMDNLAGRKLSNLREVIKVSVFLHTVFTETFCPFWEARASID